MLPDVPSIRQPSPYLRCHRGIGSNNPPLPFFTFYHHYPIRIRKSPVADRYCYTVINDNTSTMKRLTEYLNKYGLLSEDLKVYLHRHGKLKSYSKGEYFVTQYDIQHSWCFLLEGLAGYQTLDNKGNLKLERLCPVNHYFVGTKHIFSKSTNRTAIQFLQPSVVYIISNEDLKNGIRLFDELNEIYHIMKQHELDIRQIFLRTPNIPRQQRLAYIYDHLPEVKDKITVRQICSLLGFTNSRQYYEALDFYYNNSIKY